MALYAFVGAKGAPGVTTTTLAMALAWPDSTLLVDADPAGGTLNTGFLGAQVRATDGLARLANATVETLPGLLQSQLIDLGNSPQGAWRLLLPGVSSSAQAAGVAQVWPLIADYLADVHVEGGARVDAFVDCGRLAVEYRPDGLFDRASCVFVVLRADLSSVSLARPTIAELRRRTYGRLALAIVEKGPYRPDDIATELDTPIGMVMPWLPAEASDLASGKTSTRSRLLRTAQRAGATVRNTAALTSVGRHGGKLE